MRTTQAKISQKKVHFTLAQNIALLLLLSYLRRRRNILISAKVR